MIYKVLNLDGTPCHGGIGRWPLPVNSSLGDWLEVAGDLVPCENGIDLCDGESQLLNWIGPAIYEAEYEGECLREADKLVVRRARLLRRFATWNESTARLFACDCAERALARIAKPDPRSFDTIRIGRNCARGLASAKDLATPYAATNAAYFAARHAAFYLASKPAFYVGSNATIASNAASNAAYDAAYDAAYHAAFYVASNAARHAGFYEASNAEREWQAGRLRQYLSGEAS